MSSMGRRSGGRMSSGRRRPQMNRYNPNAPDYRKVHGPAGSGFAGALLDALLTTGPRATKGVAGA
jgi:hypothetical protein